MRSSSSGLKQIAEILNLSTGTVSRALTGKGEIAESTRAQVTAVAARIDYTGHLKRSRGAKTFRRLSVCVGNPCTLGNTGLDPSFVGFHYVVAIERAASAEDLSVLVSFVDAGGDVSRLEQLPVLRPDETHAAILIYPYPESFVKRLSQRMPVVSVEHIYPSLPIDTIGPAQAADAMLAVEHLHRLGHRRIGYIGDEEARGHRLTTGLRHAGYVSGLSRYELPYRSEDVVNVVGPTVAKQDLAAWVKSRMNDGVTAVVTAIDRHGYLLWEQLPEIGVRIPQDLSIVGIGGTHRAADQPQLTTWRCDYDTIAKTAINALRRRTEGNSGINLYQEIASVFVEGASSAPPA